MKLINGSLLDSVETHEAESQWRSQNQGREDSRTPKAKQLVPDAHPGYYFLKRLMDITGAVLLLLAFLPVFVIIPLLIRRDGGSALYLQERLGKGGKPFCIYKFRSMAVDAEDRLHSILDEDPVAAREWSRTHKLKNDPRITLLGRFLRKTSLDELPQVINILKGEMSLVGPRPIVSAEREKYGKWFAYYAAATPGLTGLWQVTGRNDISYMRRVALDRRYATKRSTLLDVKVALKTPWAMFAGRTGH